MTSASGNPYSEYAQVEKPAIDLFAELGWETQDCFSEFDAGDSTLGRETKSEVVLVERLRSALQRLNADLPAQALTKAIEELTRGRAAMSPVQANSEVYDLITDGVRVTVEDSDGNGNGEATEIVRVIDWDDPANNDFFLASQFWVTGDMYTRRPDLIGFVNGLPHCVHRAKGNAQRAKGRLRQQPEGLQGHHTPPILVQRADHPLQRQRGQNRQRDLELGALRRLEEDQQRGRGGRRIARNRHSRHLRIRSPS